MQIMQWVIKTRHDAPSQILNIMFYIKISTTLFAHNIAFTEVNMFCVLWKTHFSFPFSNNT